MPHRVSLKLLLLSMLFCINSISDVYAKNEAPAPKTSQGKKMYRWIDENGNVYFSDQVPPDQVQFKRDTLNDKARVLDTVEKAKTPEQLEQQRRLDTLRKEQDKIIAKQASNDKVLLTTYRRLDDLHRALENKLAALDVENKITEGNLKRSEQQLQQQQLQAAEHERNARKVPDKLLADIAASKRQIDATKQELLRQGLSKEMTEREFKADMARFQFLTQGSGGDSKIAQNNLAASNANNDLGLYVCQDSAQCDKAWQIAGEFVAKFSTTGEDVSNERLIMRAAPFEDTDISLSVSKLERDKELQIFLDIRCKQSNIGKELCASEKAQAIRRGFAPYLQLQLTSQ
jgi:hypothetical protein